MVAHVGADCRSRNRSSSIDMNAWFRIGVAFRLDESIEAQIGDASCGGPGNVVAGIQGGKGERCCLALLPCQVFAKRQVQVHRVTVRKLSPTWAARGVLSF